METQASKSAGQAEVTPTGCCPPFDPATYADREVVWKDQLFVQEHVPSFFHVPIGMGRKIVRAKEQIDAAGASPEHPLMLSDEQSPWGSNLLIEVSRPVPGAEMTQLSGRFFTRVYDGPFKEMGRWAGDMEKAVSDRGQKLQKLYFAYTTCPACAKAYGHNYVVGFAKVADAPN